MKKVNLLFAVHNHQPVGNFDHVFKEATEKCYLPFIEALENHPGVRISLHYSGPLWEWFMERAPEIFSKIQGLLNRGQIELLAGGFYEPILHAIPYRDAMGQIEMAKRFVGEKFKYNPEGIWLAERVWDPALPRLLSEAGIRYTFVDDHHFTCTGLKAEELSGYYVTEREGYPLYLFPISKRLRYMIPFHQVEETIEYLQGMATVEEGVAVTYGDDGEKFGMWPGTYIWVYEKGWLEDFFGALEENKDWINMITFSEYIDRYAPTGRIYLPSSSYEEMMEWAGGMWENFLVKYPEANNMHKKMLYVSGLVDEAEARKKDAISGTSPALVELYKGQCNCAYWHGIFGGLYLGHLRHAVYEHLINAENIADKEMHGTSEWIKGERIDFDKDGYDEVLISNKKINAYFDVDHGGALFELDYKPKSFNLADTLSRKKEAYHHKLKENLTPEHEEEEPSSIHEMKKMKKGDLGDQLFYDWYGRYSFLDHFLGDGTTLEDFRRCQYGEAGNFVNQPYEISGIDSNGENKGIRLRLKREGSVCLEGKGQEIEIRKTFFIPRDFAVIQATYEILNKDRQKTDLWFGIEFNLTFLSGDDPEKYYLFRGRDGLPWRGKGQGESLSSAGEMEDVKTLQMRDDRSGFAVTFDFEHPARIWRFPLETVSQSEEGFEKTYQGSVILAHWKLNLSSQKSGRIFVKMDIGKKVEDKKQ